MENGTEKEGLHRAWAGIALGFYVTHGIGLVTRDLAPHLLWSCHLASILLAAGIWFGRPRLSATALLWQAIGLPAWIASFSTGGNSFLPTSTLTHLLGLGLSIAAIRSAGFPAGTWWRAMAGLSGLWIVTRLLVPAGSNVNITRRFWFGGEGEYVSFPVYIGILALTATLVFFALERLVRAVVFRAGRR